MPPHSFDNSAELRETLRLGASRAEIPWKGRVLMLVLNLIPLLHVLVAAAILLLMRASLSNRILLFFVLVYLLPPLLGRCLLPSLRSNRENIPIGSRKFLAWWALFQLQVLFCRLPVLEELLRLVPGCYSLWLRLWGAKIGRLTYWSAGTLLTDRSFLEIGDDVVLGAGVRLNAHVLARAPGGEMELILAPISIGDRTVLGGYSLLTAGTKIAADETMPAFLISPPHSEWKDNRRVRKKN